MTAANLTDKDRAASMIIWACIVNPHKNFGFIEFRTVAEAESVFALNGIELLGRKLHVNRAHGYEPVPGIVKDDLRKHGLLGSTSVSPDGDPVFGPDLPEPDGMRDGSRQPTYDATAAAAPPQRAPGSTPVMNPGQPTLAEIARAEALGLPSPTAALAITHAPAPAPWGAPAPLPAAAPAPVPAPAMPAAMSYEEAMAEAMAEVTTRWWLRVLRTSAWRSAAASAVTAQRSQGSELPFASALRALLPASVPDQACRGFGVGHAAGPSPPALTVAASANATIGCCSLCWLACAPSWPAGVAARGAPRRDAAQVLVAWVRSMPPSRTKGEWLRRFGCR